MWWVLGRWVAVNRSYFGSRPRLSELPQQGLPHLGQATRVKATYQGPVLTHTSSDREFILHVHTKYS